jgi:N6-adenosine-specific RNA methylase IME4
MKFQVIVADPPWSFSDSLKMDDVARGAKSNYNTMRLPDIVALPINKLISPKGSVLALWVPSSMLQDGLDTMKAWGFTHKQTYVWVKTKKEPITSMYQDLNDSLGFGMGRLFRQCHEICLVGISSTEIYKKLNNKSQRSVSLATNLKHSSKPEFLQDSLERMFPRTKKLELFARRNRKGWICLGNEVCNGEDIRVSLAKL